MKSPNVVKMCLLASLVALSSLAYGDTHWNVQDVNENGYGTHPDMETTNKVTVEGIILNRPDYMLDSTPDYNNPEETIGGIWQLSYRATSMTTLVPPSGWDKTMPISGVALVCILTLIGPSSYIGSPMTPAQLTKLNPAIRLELQAC